MEGRLPGPGRELAPNWTSAACELARQNSNQSPLSRPGGLCAGYAGYAGLDVLITLTTGTFFLHLDRGGPSFKIGCDLSPDNYPLSVSSRNPPCRPRPADRRQPLSVSSGKLDRPQLLHATALPQSRPHPSAKNCSDFTRVGKYVRALRPALLRGGYYLDSGRDFSYRPAFASYKCLFARPAPSRLSLVLIVSAISFASAPFFAALMAARGR